MNNTCWALFKFLLLMRFRRLYIIVSITAIGLGFWSSWNAYFEERLTCAIEWKDVIVSLDSAHLYCKTHIEDISEWLESVESMLDTIETYISANWNVGYRQPLYDQLLTKKHQLVSFRSSIVQAMNQYEYWLFARIKPLVLTIVENDRRKCWVIWTTLSDVHPFESWCRLGQDVQYAGIVASENLDELIPLLLEYVRNK